MPLTRSRHWSFPPSGSLFRPVFLAACYASLFFFFFSLLVWVSCFSSQLRCVGIYASETPVTITQCLFFLVLACDPKAARLDDQHEMERKVGTCKCLLAIFARLETTTDAPVLQPARFLSTDCVCLPSFASMVNHRWMEMQRRRRYGGGKCPSER